MASHFPHPPAAERVDAERADRPGQVLDEPVAVGQTPDLGVTLQEHVASVRRAVRLLGTGVEELFKKGLTNRPLVKGDEIIIPNIALMGGFLPFIVISTQPTGVVMVGDHTELSVKTEPVESKDTISPSTTYDDIGGLEEELQRVREMIELPLKHPELFDRLGIDAPKGVLLYGPPGTGKTLIAKAVAHQTNATFIRFVGSELVQKYIGEGARLVRELFELAKEKAPSIVFIDELDSIGAKRLEVATSGDREVQRTLMQLLAELDGFNPIGDVKIIGATNRPDILDEALLRPGRFDRIIEIPIPNYEGRAEIFKIHMSKMNIELGINPMELAVKAENATGADIKSICTEAGMFAIRDNRDTVSNCDFERAIAYARRGNHCVAFA